MKKIIMLIKISGINYYEYGEYLSSVDIAFPIEYITDKDKVKNEYELYLKLKHKFERYELEI